MSETADTQSKISFPRGASADKHALAQVEKWMAIVREISHERQATPRPTVASLFGT